MDEQQMRSECIQMLESLFENGQDVLYPVAPDVDQITVCGSSNGYVLSSEANGPKTYDNAEAVLDALVEVERISGEEAPLESVLTSLRHIS